MRLILRKEVSSIKYVFQKSWYGTEILIHVPTLMELHMHCSQPNQFDIKARVDGSEKMIFLCDILYGRRVVFTIVTINMAVVLCILLLLFDSLILVETFFLLLTFDH